MNNFQNFHITVKSLIFWRNKILLTKSADPDFFGALECPGGRVDFGETIEEALFRELKEELSVNISDYSSAISLFDVNQRGAAEYDPVDGKQILELYYKIEVEDSLDFSFTLSDEASGFIWLSKTDNLDVFSYHVESRKNVYAIAQKNLL